MPDETTLSYIRSGSSHARLVHGHLIMTPGMRPSEPGMTPSSIESDLGDLLEKEAREEALEMLRDPIAGESMLKSSSQASTFSLERAKALSALDLTLPKQMVNASSEECEAKGLVGYQALHFAREESAKYRQAYSNWRRGAAHGARGEGKFKGARGEGAAASAAPPAQAPLLSPKSGMKKSQTAKSDVDLEALRRREQKKMTRLDEEPGSAPPPEQSWLKFAFNPFSEKDLPRSTLPLCEANLPKMLAANTANLSLPAVGSRTATSYIAHVGVGGFHRSHLAFVTDVLSQMQHADGAEGERWGILGVGLMPWDRKINDALKKQDCLYTLLLRGNSKAEARVIGAIHDFLFVPDNPEASLERLCQPSIKIMSLTVTEKGYYRNVDGELDTSNALVKEDIEQWAQLDGGARGLQQPKTAFGLICTVLQRRRAAGLGPLTVLSCDNMPMNGSVCRAVTLQFARAVDAGLAKWMEGAVPFPNSMVDRITPATEPEHRALLREEYGVDDEWPVIAEPFLQWVIEDSFCAGRPQWQLALPADVLITSNVEPYELMKLRLLNSSHSALSYTAILCKHRFVDDALADPDIFAFLRAYMSEVVKTISEVQGVNLADYQRTLLERFSNTYIKDKLSRLAQDGSQKFMNTLQDALIGYRAQTALMQQMVARSSWIQPRHGNTIDGTEMVALALAAFMQYTVGHDADGEPFVLEDPLAEVLRPIACRAFASDEAADATTRLDATRSFIRTIFGDEVAGWEAFVKNVFSHAEQLQSTSCREVLCAFRHSQLRVLRAERSEYEAKLRELHRSELLLTPPEDRSGLLRSPPPESSQAHKERASH